MTVNVPRDALDVTAFWREAGPKKWFAKDAAFDVEFRDRFAHLYCRASRAELAFWRLTAEGALAEILLLDQFPRNAFRGTPWMFATDPLAREAAGAIVHSVLDKQLDDDLRSFAYMPFDHSEDLADQERAVELLSPFSENHAYHAKAHRDVIARFGRFPHRNAILGRLPTDAEAMFLAEGGYTP
jgi:uncharacterized protein (DUF924 family)